MRLFVLLAGLLICFATCAFAQATTAEAQSFFDAYSQTTLHVFSGFMLAYILLSAFLAALFTMLNLRTLAYLSFIALGAFALNTPYYLPDQPKIVFGVGMILFSVAGLILRLLQLVKKLGKKEPSA